MASINEIVERKLRRADELGFTVAELEMQGSPSIGFNGFRMSFMKDAHKGWRAIYSPLGLWDLTSLEMTNAVDRAVIEYNYSKEVE